ncbi:glycosyltransferase family 4 protein [Hirschia litorea]|uniref:Glycosyltransferase family 4 protein n=1 Tax=Hirschia litorea TaxID=1199156 RepID=A0ABW2IMI2_9PROT
MNTDLHNNGASTIPKTANVDLAGKTILQVIPDLAAGGAERTTIEVAEALVKAGARALVASSGGRLEDELRDVGGELFSRASLPSKNPVKLIQNMFWLKSLIKSEKIDLVHARSRAPAWSAYWACGQTHTPFVTTYHGAYNAKSAAKHWYNSVMARGDCVIANSSYIAEHVALTYPDAANKIITIPRGVDLEAFQPSMISQDRKDAILKAWFDGKTPKKPILLLPGRLTAWKGQRQAIEALIQLAKNDEKDWTLILAGDDQGRSDYTQSLHTLINEASLQNQIKLVGHCSDMAAAFSVSDIVLAPSQEPEAFGRVAAEAGALEKPTIVSDLGGQRETVIQGKTGLRIKPHDVGEFASALRTLLYMSKTDRDAMGHCAGAHIRANYSKHNLQNATLGVYVDVLERNKNDDLVGQIK